MRRNFGKQTWLYPMPVLIIGTYDAEGKPNAMNAAWGGICEYNKIMIDLAEHKTTANIAVTGAFTVAVADVEHVAACDYVGVVSANEEPDKFAKAGFTATKSEFINAPIINELPLTLECELEKILDDGMYIGRIVNISADERFVGDDDLPDLSKFCPITFDPIHNTYTAMGAKVGNAFEDGLSLKD